MLLALALAACFLLAYLADRIGLATIVGAFAAGLILDGVHYRDLGERTKHKHRGADPPDRRLPGAGLLRADGGAGRPLDLRPDGGAGLRGAARRSPPSWGR